MSDDGITIITQTTAERRQETIDLFNQIRPYLDKNYTYSHAIRIVKNLPPRANRYSQAWYRDVVAYGESQGYKYEDYSGKRKVENL